MEEPSLWPFLFEHERGVVPVGVQVRAVEAHLREELQPVHRPPAEAARAWAPRAWPWPQERGGGCSLI
eukprot:7823435-Heterocapsa_arctica.AAC.1